MLEPAVTTEWEVRTNDKNDLSTCFYFFQKKIGKVESNKDIC